MLTFPRTNLFLLLTLFTALTASATQPESKPQPVKTTLPVAAPAFLDVVAFTVRVDGETHPLTVTMGPTLLRIDQPVDRLSVIYDSQADHYTGLEHSNYTYWEFSWPEVRALVETSQRYETRLRDLNSEGLSITPPSTDTNAPGEASNTIGSDNSGYVWRQTPDKKKVAGFDCNRWTGDTVSGESVEAWCYNGTLPKMQAAMERLRVINEPMALVPVRPVVPPLVFSFYDALIKGGVTPIVITWGGNRDKNSFAYVETKTRDGKSSIFTVPKTYMKTTLVTMDGMTNPTTPKK